ncbi:MAG: acyl carrier protein [bacterium (Candidatus Stahlbacteria) CG23_combo_of_CG06-09_8_20_14_all_34_7]|nr:MAG: acyl carrier protein [bacterium (Candidatus Stahlbacteria) CG23_combo_of_CG06-09_8_20_14_all_34_7]
MMSQVYETIKKMLVQELKFDETKITPDAAIMQDLGADSLDLMDLVNELEKVYGIKIPQEDYAKLKTVGDVATYIEGKTAK